MTDKSRCLTKPPAGATRAPLRLSPRLMPAVKMRLPAPLPGRAPALSPRPAPPPRPASVKLKPNSPACAGRPRRVPEMTQKLYIETVGCQMNVLDSELVVGSLRRLGYALADTPADADVI